MKVLLGILLSLLPPLVEAQSADEIMAVRRLSSHVMQVSADTLGSAVAIAEHLAVTNCHVLGDAMTAHVTRGGLGSRATLKSGDTGRDLCLLELDHSPSFPVKLGRAESLSLGDKVYAVGFGAARLSVGVGQITALYPYEGVLIVRSDAPFAAGASGGALFDSEGNLVGVLTFFRRGVQTSSYWAMPTEWIRSLTDGPLGTVDRSRPPIWGTERSQSIRFLEVAGYEIDGDWTEMQHRAQQWLSEEPDNKEAIRALRFANAKLR